jgi:hypothetical protein
VTTPVLFLDFDGVLNHTGTNQRHNGFVGLDPANVARLNAVMREVPETRIVISSTWRLQHGVAELRGLLSEAGFEHPRAVVGKTPGWKESATGSIVGAHPTRGHEIQAWIDAEPAAPTAIAILDDAEDMAHLAHRLVRTDLWAGGLLDEHVPQVVAKLREVA